MGHGTRYLARPSAKPPVGAARTGTFLGERHRHIAGRRCKNRAIVAVGRSIVAVTLALLSAEDAQPLDLGPDHYDSQLRL